MSNAAVWYLIAEEAKGILTNKTTRENLLKRLDILTPYIWYATQLMQYRMLILLMSLQAYFVNSLKRVLSEPKKFEVQGNS